MFTHSFPQVVSNLPLRNSKVSTDHFLCHTMLVQILYHVILAIVPMIFEQKYFHNVIQYSDLFFLMKHSLFQHVLNDILDVGI